MSEHTTVVVIRSLSFTGTTWLNAILGSHPEAFALGPCDRPWRLLQKPSESICRVHGNECSFWPQFAAQYDQHQNFFLQLARFSGCKVIVTNNPSSIFEKDELRHPELVVMNVHLVRDGRAIATSHSRHANVHFVDAVINFLCEPFHGFVFDENNPDVLCLRYEEIAADPSRFLAPISAFVGIKYGPEALRYWEFDHHIAAGNRASIASIGMEDKAEFRFSSNEYYARQFKALRAGERESFVDDRWRDELSRRERFVFDVYSGMDNARFGYERDKFSLDEVQQFGTELARGVDDSHLPASKLEAASMFKRGSKVVNVPEYLHGPKGQMSPPSMREQLRLAWLWRRGITIPPESLKNVALFVRRRGIHLSPRTLFRLSCLVVGATLLAFGWLAVLTDKF